MEQESEEYTHSYLQESPLMSDPHILPEESLTQNIPEPFFENTEQNIQEEAEEEEALDRVETPVQPQNSPQKKIESDVVFNISCTKYKVVREVGEGLFQWNLSTDPQSDWDVAWVDTTPDAITFSRIRSHQTINFFPGIQCVARKDQLSTNLKRLKRKFHENYNFFPDTYILPSEYNELRVQFMKDRKNKKIFIMKPQASCQGRGIFLTDNIKNISNTDKYVAQRYLSKPYLLDGLKFDLRIYVLLTSCNPLQIYLFEDGLARFATETYKSPDNNNLSDLFMHLTNYAINKDSPNFIFNASASDPNIGHKRSIKALFKVLEERGHDVKELWEEIKRIVIKTFISVQPNLKQNYKSHLFTRNRTDACFQVFGIDVIIDDAFKPWLLEVNASPSFTTDTPLDKNIKERAISDALRIMNITADSRLRRKAKTEADVIEVQRIGETKEGQNSAWFGGYEKIFPLDDPEQYAENYDAFLGEVNHFWNLALGINEKRDKQIKRNYDYRAITAGNFYPKRDSFKARFESPTPEVKSSNVTDRSEVQSRGDGGKRKKQKVVDTPPVKFFDIRTPIISPSNQSYFAKQNAPHYLSKRSNRPPLAPKEESNQPSIILESKTSQMPTPSTAVVITEKDTNSSTLHTFTIEHSHPHPAQPVLTQPKETSTTTTTRALPPKPKPVQRDLNTLFQKSAENFSKINTSEIKKEYKEYKQAVKKNPQTGLSKNSRTSASARESVNGLLEKSVEIPRKRTAPKVPKNSFTVFSATPQRTSVVEDPELSKNELPKRFAQQIFRSQAFLENSPLKNISRDKNAIVTQIASEKSKTRSSTSTQRPNSSKAKVESHNPIYSNLVKGTDSSYQHLTPKLSNFMMPKLIESLSNLSLKKVAVASPGVKEKSFTGGDSKIVGMKVSNQAHLNYVSQTKA